MGEAKKAEMQDNVRKYLVKEMLGSATLQKFKVMENLLVMYDENILKAEKNDKGGYTFTLISEVSQAQIKAAQLRSIDLEKSDNMEWNRYVNRGRA